MSPWVIDAAIAAGALGGWSVLYGSIALATRPAAVEPQAATLELGEEPPAVAGLLANRWRVTEGAAGATLLDLVARGHLELRQPGDDPGQTTLHVRDPGTGGLHGYERHVLNRVTSLAVDRVVPVAALPIRNRWRAVQWKRKFREQVAGAARAGGLSRRRLDGRRSLALVAAATVAAAALAFAVYRAAERSLYRGGIREAILTAVVSLVAMVVLTGLLAERERDTAAGRAAAGRWLGAGEWLRGHDEFANLPPASVTVWDRYLAYGAALGVAPLTSSVLHLGMGSRRLVWSSHGGTWHRVRVSYPWLRPHLGRATWQHACSSLFVAALGGVMFWLADVMFWLADSDPADGDLPDGLVALGFLGIGLFLLGAGQGVGGSILVRATLAAVVVWGLSVSPADDVFIPVWAAVSLLLPAAAGYTAVRVAIDRARVPRRVTGEVLWAGVWRRRLGLLGRVFFNTPRLYYLAVDDGTADRTTAWALPAELAGGFADGDTVTITARRWSRRVLGLTVVRRGRGDLTVSAPAPGGARHGS